MKSQVIELVSPLAGTASYISGTRDMHHVARDFGVAVCNFVVEVDSDQSGTVEIDESTDQIIWTLPETPTVYTGDEGILQIAIQPAQRYVRAKFVNGSTLQTRFAMTTGVDYSS